MDLSWRGQGDHRRGRRQRRRR